MEQLAADLPPQEPLGFLEQLLPGGDGVPAHDVQLFAADAPQVNLAQGRRGGREEVFPRPQAR